VIFIQKLFGVDYNMISPQCSIRIPKELDARLIAYAKQNHVTKTKVMIDALAHYLSRTGNVPLIDRVAEIEQSCCFRSINQEHELVHPNSSKYTISLGRL
jgi:predicted DNA-binding protein